jgi:hypothetical protein
MLKQSAAMAGVALLLALTACAAKPNAAPVLDIAKALPVSDAAPIIRSRAGQLRRSCAIGRTRL